MDRTYGLQFPVYFEGVDPNFGLPAYPGLLDSIESSIRIILGWSLNQRFFLPEFGSPLEDMLQEPGNDSNSYALRFYLIQALKKWEKRIDITKVTVTSEGEHFHIQIEADVIPIETKLEYSLIV